MTKEVEVFKKMVQESDNIVFFGGAGVSTESGIPDFRSENGIYSAVSEYGYPPETILSHSFYLKNPEIFFQYYKKNLLFLEAKPNMAHLGLAELERQGKLKAVITQNIDNLHQAAGSKKVLELHGTLFRNYCTKCGKDFNLSYVLKTDDITYCDACGGIVRPDVVLYEEGLDEHILLEAMEYIRKADVFIVGGTSLAVYPAAGLIRDYHGQKLVLINKGETAYDTRANLVIRQNIGTVFQEILGLSKKK